jgi:hypothetical protein
MYIEQLICTLKGTAVSKRDGISCSHSAHTPVEGSKEQIIAVVESVGNRN